MCQCAKGRRDPETDRDPQLAPTSVTERRQICDGHGTYFFELMP